MPSVLPDGEPVPDDGSLPGDAVAEVGQRPLSLYVHVPFCASRCGYCDFNTYTLGELGDARSPEAYVAAAFAELDLAVRVLGGQAPAVSTVFFGGGTPTLLPARELAGLLAGIGERFGLAEGAEVTTEANPESVDPAYLHELKAAGFTRISFGMQPAAPHALEVLDRRHTPGRALEAVRWAREAGFTDVSLDLIYGTPGESMADWRASLDSALSAEPDHISAYSLIVEPGTRLAARVRRGELPMPDDDDHAERYLVAEDVLTAGGFAAYEVSNWARTGHACRHNLAYWRGDHWWGVGPGAHSHVGRVRWWNVKHPRTYATRLAGRRTPAHARELLDDEARRFERVLLELRLAEGLPLGVLLPGERERVPGLVAEGLVVEQNGRLMPTLRGRLLADGVVERLTR